jgi:hypothetical protein
MRRHRDTGRVGGGRSVALGALQDYPGGTRPRVHAKGPTPSCWEPGLRPSCARRPVAGRSATNPVPSARWPEEICGLPTIPV